MTQKNKQNNLVEVKGITKHFGKVTALEHVDFDICPGEIVGLLGDNGAGKSTLIKILSGIYKATKGKMYFEGKEVSFSSPKEAIKAGVETTHQDLALVDQLPIYRNVFSGREYTKRFLKILPILDKKRMVEESISALGGIGIQIDSVESLVGNLSGGQKQSVAIGRASHFNAKLVIMDEPTAAMSLNETEKILQLMVDLKNSGAGVIFISHNIYHVFSIVDRITILGHGKSIAHFKKEDTTIEEVSDIIRKH